jgi:hypothetical protein
MKSNKRPSLTLVAASLALACAAAGSAQAAATIVINNLNLPGVGFNDPPRPPVGGNTGTTIGQQRLIAFTHAANIWGDPDQLGADRRQCAVRAAGLHRHRRRARQRRRHPGVRRLPWRAEGRHPVLVRTGQQAVRQRNFGYAWPQINARFNSELGKANCLAGSSFYLGLDANEGSNIDFVATLLHEMGHGLGFQTFTNGAPAPSSPATRRPGTTTCSTTRPTSCGST